MRPSSPTSVRQLKTELHSLWSFTGGLFCVLRLRKPSREPFSTAANRGAKLRWLYQAGVKITTRTCPWSVVGFYSVRQFDFNHSNSVVRSLGLPCQECKTWKQTGQTWFFTDQMRFRCRLLKKHLFSYTLSSIIQQYHEVPNNRAFTQFHYNNFRDM